MNQKEFAKRRKQLMRLMGRDSIAVIPAAPTRARNRDIEYPYRQDSDFHYLTGFPEPETVAVLVPGRKEGEYLLFCRERDPKLEVWIGHLAGQEEACAIYGADDSFPINDLDDILPGLMETKERVFYTLGRYPEFDQRLIGWINGIRSKSRSGIHAPAEFVSLEHHLHEMRLIKSQHELKTMRTAAHISAAAHRHAMQICRTGLMEYEIEAELLLAFRKANCVPAYPCIVGGGANTCVLHYVNNNAQLQDGDLLLIDAGAEYDTYASDITRTFPVNGRFTGPQKAVYELVLAAQAAAIDRVRAGNHWDDPHKAAVEVLTEGMVDLGILKGTQKS
jgi:Xaa-Pro aminopeptidase